MKKIFLFLFAAAIALGGYGIYIYNKPHKNMQRQAADFELSATKLYADFEENESAANTQYLDKVIAVNGSIRQIVQKDDQVSIILDTDSLLGGITCQLDDPSKQDFSSLNEGDQVSIKGICTGMLLDVVLVRCIIIS
jgi:hypothetical protein